MGAFSITRRAFTRLGLGALALGAVLSNAIPPTVSAATRRAPLALTPAAVDADDLTPAQTEGPYFTRNSPERVWLAETTAGGTPLVITGRVLAVDGTPIPGALLDFWQANDAGRYDNQGYELRGHQYTDPESYYTLGTVVPGLYPGRTRHIHVKVQAPNGPVLTTQLYFPNEARNASDGIFNAALVLPVQQSETGQVATFDFVINTA
jgi:protocatechuate 3,4-dioxygenase beta subunit